MYLENFLQLFILEYDSNKELLDTHIEQIDSMCDYIKRKVIWENQEGQPDYFDNLSKSEQMALLGIANNVVALYQSLINYKQWFQ